MNAQEKFLLASKLAWRAEKEGVMDPKVNMNGYVLIDMGNERVYCLRPEPDSVTEPALTDYERALWAQYQRISELEAENKRLLDQLERTQGYYTDVLEQRDRLKNAIQNAIWDMGDSRMEIDHGCAAMARERLVTALASLDTHPHTKEELLDGEE